MYRFDGAHFYFSDAQKRLARFFSRKRYIHPFFLKPRRVVFSSAGAIELDIRLITDRAVKTWPKLEKLTFSFKWRR